MPKRRIAWSCWNYLSFTKAIPLTAAQESDYSSNEDLYDEKGKHPQRLNIQEVEQVSLLVFDSLPFSLSDENHSSGPVSLLRSTSGLSPINDFLQMV